MAVKKQTPGFVSPGIRPPKEGGYVIAELRYDSQIGYSSAGFSGPASVQKAVDGLARILESFAVRRVSSHFGMRTGQVRRRVTEAPATLDVKVSGEFAQSGFVQIIPKRKKEAADLAKRLSRSNAVWKAVEAPAPVPAAAPTGSSIVSRNFEVCQGYLASAPDGIGATEVWSSHGAKGKGVTICDIEGNWNFQHEDLPRSVRHIGGQLIASQGWQDHGTAVLGEMISKPGRSGTVGIAHRARAVVHSAVVGGIFNTAVAINNATRRLNTGDVILIELQATGPNGKYVAMQYWDDVFSAIRVAVAKGITVIEAAGNGNENFNLPIFRNTGLQKDSGAIVVGAGIPPTNFLGNFGSDWGFTDYSVTGVPR